MFHDVWFISDCLDFQNFCWFYRITSLLSFFLFSWPFFISRSCFFLLLKHTTGCKVWLRGMILTNQWCLCYSPATWYLGKKLTFFLFFIVLLHFNFCIFSDIKSYPLYIEDVDEIELWKHNQIWKVLFWFLISQINFLHCLETFCNWLEKSWMIYDSDIVLLDEI